MVFASCHKLSFTFNECFFFFQTMTGFYLEFKFIELIKSPSMSHVETKTCLFFVETVKSNLKKLTHHIILLKQSWEAYLGDHVLQ